MKNTLRNLAFLAALLVSLSAAAQPKFEPQVGQAGKDVIWVPTPDEVVERMLIMAQTGPNDIHFDLGAGDGKIAIAAAKKFGARATGIEYNPDMVKHANANAQAAGVAGVGPGKATIRHGDIFVTDFSSATVVTLYLLPALNMKLRPTILAMRPGTRVVSHSFTMEDWQPDAGSQKTDLSFDQTFQKISGSVKLGATQGGLREARLSGFNIAFAYLDQTGVRRDFTGTVTGGKMEGSFRDDKGGQGRWTATKKLRRGR